MKPPPHRDRIDSARHIAAAAATLLCSVTALPGVAHAQLGPPPDPNRTDNNVQLSAHAAQLDIGSNFLQRLGREAIYGYAMRENSGGGGASRDTASPLYRSWAEVYGLTSRTGAQGDFVGDHRKTIGIVGGIGATLAPGLSIGLSVDQSRTKIDVPLAFQNATLDLTQIGGNVSYTNGPWTVALAGVHGFAGIDTRRATGAGDAASTYRGRIDGVLAEVNYLFARGQSRIVPKLAFEHVSAKTDGFQESGGLNPVVVAGASGDRSRIMAGAEIGQYWVVGQQAIDVSAYGKFVDNFSQNVGAVQVSLGASSISVQGIRESQYGADAGAQASWIISNYVRLYANYDGRYRDGFQSHQGTGGIELKW